MYSQVFGCIYLQCWALPQTYGLTFTQKSQYLLSNAIHRATFQLDGSLSQTFWILQYAFLDFRFYSLSVTWWDPIFKNLTKLNIVLIWILITCHVIRKHCNKWGIKIEDLRIFFIVHKLLPALLAFLRTNFPFLVLVQFIGRDMCTLI